MILTNNNTFEQFDENHYFDQIDGNNTFEQFDENHYFDQIDGNYTLENYMEKVGSVGPCMAPSG